LCLSGTEDVVGVSDVVPLRMISRTKLFNIQNVHAGECSSPQP